MQVQAVHASHEVNVAHSGEDLTLADVANPLPFALQAPAAPLLQRQMLCTLQGARPWQPYNIGALPLQVQAAHSSLEANAAQSGGGVTLADVEVLEDQQLAIVDEVHRIDGTMQKLDRQIEGMLRTVGPAACRGELGACSAKVLQEACGTAMHLMRSSSIFFWTSAGFS